jgi:hypothetical protein
VLVNGTARFTPRNLSMIMLAVNAGVPPLFLVAMTALIVRQMVIA